jgi:hypothetical protein
MDVPNILAHELFIAQLDCRTVHQVPHFFLQAWAISTEMQHMHKDLTTDASEQRTKPG